MENSYIAASHTMNLNPLLSIIGRYKLKDGDLELSVDYLRERNGIKVGTANYGFQFGIFSIYEGKVKTFPKDSSFMRPHSIDCVQRSANSKCIVIKIDDGKYHKLSDDPNKYYN